jgi:F0F1-type ATP synthase membrane subunit b/b'
MRFADHMQAFAREVRDCSRARTAFVARVNENAQQFLAEARGFLHRLGQEHRDRAAQVREFLAADRRKRQTAVEDFRHEIGRRLEQLREQTHARMEQASHDRHATVAALRKTFDEARASLAADLHSAARFWRERDLA